MTGTTEYEQFDAVAVISLNRPDSLNGFTPDMCKELLHDFETAHNDESVRAIVFTGVGRCFSAGADLKQGWSDGRPVRDKLRYEYRPILAAIGNVPKPVIAAVPGFAAGIGLSFAMHSDLLMMADDAFLLSPFTKISLLPDGGANWLLVRQLGYHRAFQLSIESERIDAERCLEYGIANKVVPAAELRQSAIEWARQLTERAPLSIAATKKAMRFAQDNSWDYCYDLEAELQQQLRDSDDATEGANAFLEKRDPVFKGR